MTATYSPAVSSPLNPLRRQQQLQQQRQQCTSPLNPSTAPTPRPRGSSSSSRRPLARRDMGPGEKWMRYRAADAWRRCMLWREAQDYERALMVAIREREAKQNADAQQSLSRRVALAVGLMRKLPGVKPGWLRCETAD